MKRLVLLTIVALTPSGCLHLELRKQTVNTAGTLTDLMYEQVLNNVAMFSRSPEVMPYFAVPSGGTVSLSKSDTANIGATHNPTLGPATQIGGITVFGYLLGFDVEKSLTENWSLGPITDADNLRRIQCAYQVLIGAAGIDHCQDCEKVLKDYFISEQSELDCLVPRGWYHVGCKKDVPKNACYVGRYCDLYVWVMPEGVGGLTKFTLTVLDLATGKPHAPVMQVVRTYKGDMKPENLETTQVTSQEVDVHQLDQCRAGQMELLPRQRAIPSAPDRGLFFLPHE